MTFIIYAPSGRRVSNQRFRNLEAAIDYVCERTNVVEEINNASSSFEVELIDTNDDVWCIKRSRKR